jgi:hypothetical protein
MSQPCAHFFKYLGCNPNLLQSLILFVLAEMPLITAIPASITVHADTTVPIVANFPPLTTIWTPPAECQNRWMLQTTVTNGSEKALAYSTYPTADPSDRLYFLCHPFAQASMFSPGVCPEGMRVADVTQHLYIQSSRSVQTLWQANCCKVYVFPPHIMSAWNQILKALL